jgi:hypothetical protein
MYKKLGRLHKKAAFSQYKSTNIYLPEGTEKNHASA